LGGGVRDLTCNATGAHEEADRLAGSRSK
jgi:hypothetical protein